MRMKTLWKTAWNLFAVIGVFSVGDYLFKRWPSVTPTILIVAAILLLLWYFWHFFFKPFLAARRGEYVEPWPADKNFDRQGWMETRSKGRGRFVLLYVLNRGIPFGVIMAVAPVIFERDTNLLFWNRLPDFCIFVFAFGYSGGEMEWRRHETAYRQGAL
jgi:hypothetical protein